jgi:hypothetical protein
MADNSTFTETNTAADGVTRRKTGKVVFDATAIVAADSARVVCGFKPRHVIWWNATDRIRLEWIDGMADDSCLKTAANGTQTLEVTGGNGGITVDSRGFRVKQNATLAGVLASKTCQFVAVE